MVRQRVRTPGRRAATTLALLTALALGPVAAQITAPATAGATTQTIWVDPVRGDDARSGATARRALRTLSAAWNRVPASRTLTRPVTIKVRAGKVSPSAAPNYWEHRWGTAAHPITIVSADGPNLVQLPSINMFDVRHLLLKGVTVRSQFDPFHCERCSHVELRRVALVGIGNLSEGEGPQETVKINQSDHIRIVDSYLAGATDNAVDLVAVQHAVIARNTIAHAQDWCAYAKGGSTDVEFDANHVHHCGTGGITLGQGTGLQFMVEPWTNHEVYGSRVTNNVLHDIEGASLGVNGGFATLVAHNTAYRTGSRAHLLEVVYGERSCDGDGEDDAACARLRDAGGWGPRAAGGDPTPIGNDQVAMVNNLVYNPDGIQSRWTHFAVYGPRAAGDGGPDPAVADDALVIRGNTIWNGPAEHDLGLGGEDQGCPVDHPTCAPALVLTANAINTTVPPVEVVADAVPVPTGPIPAGTGAGEPLPTFSWTGVVAERGVPAVVMPTSIDQDRAGTARAGLPWSPGAYAADAPTTSLTIDITGPGTVAVRSGPVRRASGTLTMLRGDWVELRARPEAERRFVGWIGACAGQRGTTCVLRMRQSSMAVGAGFA